MHIEINGESERLIQAGLASREFNTAEEAVAAMARAWTAARQSRAASIPRMSASTDIRSLAAQQGVRPFDASASAMAQDLPIPADLRDRCARAA